MTKPEWFAQQEELATQEARIAENKRIFVELVTTRKAAECKAAYEARALKKLKQQQRRAENLAVRAQESQALKHLRNKSGK